MSNSAMLIAISILVITFFVNKFLPKKYAGFKVCLTAIATILALVVIGLSMR